MRIFLILICSLALACAAGAQEPKKKAAPAGRVSKPAAGKAVGKPTTAGKPVTTGKPAGVGKPTRAGKPVTAGKPAGVGKSAPAGGVAGSAQKTKAGVTTAPSGVSAAKAKAKPFKPQHFNLASKSKPATSVAPAVNFQQNRRIQGSQNWQGSNYTVFRNYSPQWHNRNWWNGNSNRVVFVFGGWYAWNAGYWYPAWGYGPNAYYAYDGPIYGYNGLPPDQVTANVQTALQQQGYYHGEVDGLLGPLTRAAIADYQRDHALYITSAIDRPTLQSLGMA